MTDNSKKARRWNPLRWIKDRLMKSQRGKPGLPVKSFAAKLAATKQPTQGAQETAERSRASGRQSSKSPTRLRDPRRQASKSPARRPESERQGSRSPARARRQSSKSPPRHHESRHHESRHHELRRRPSKSPARRPESSRRVSKSPARRPESSRKASKSPARRPESTRHGSSSPQRQPASRRSTSKSPARAPSKRHTTPSRRHSSSRPSASDINHYPVREHDKGSARNPSSERKPRRNGSPSKRRPDGNPRSAEPPIVVNFSSATTRHGRTKEGQSQVGGTSRRVNHGTKPLRSQGKQARAAPVDGPSFETTSHHVPRARMADVPSAETPQTEVTSKETPPVGTRDPLPRDPHFLPKADAWKPNAYLPARRGLADPSGFAHQYPSCGDRAVDIPQEFSLALALSVSGDLTVDSPVQQQEAEIQTATEVQLISTQAADQMKDSDEVSVMSTAISVKITSEDVAVQPLKDSKISDACGDDGEAAAPDPDTKSIASARSHGSRRSKSSGRKTQLESFAETDAENVTDEDALNEAWYMYYAFEDDEDRIDEEIYLDKKFSKIKQYKKEDDESTCAETEFGESFHDLVISRKDTEDDIYSMRELPPKTMETVQEIESTNDAIEEDKHENEAAPGMELVLAKSESDEEEMETEITQRLLCAPEYDDQWDGEEKKDGIEPAEENKSGGWEENKGFVREDKGILELQHPVADNEDKSCRGLQLVVRDTTEEEFAADDIAEEEESPLQRVQSTPINTQPSSSPENRLVTYGIEEAEVHSVAGAETVCSSKSATSLARSVTSISKSVAPEPSSLLSLPPLADGATQAIESVSSDDLMTTETALSADDAGASEEPEGKKDDTNGGEARSSSPGAGSEIVPFNAPSNCLAMCAGRLAQGRNKDARRMIERTARKEDPPTQSDNESRQTLMADKVTAEFSGMLNTLVQDLSDDAEARGPVSLVSDYIFSKEGM